ncbi:hypothetical protein ACLOJK_036804, partial [Asimina triloba]
TFPSEVAFLPTVVALELVFVFYFGTLSPAVLDDFVILRNLIFIPSKFSSLLLASALRRISFMLFILSNESSTTVHIYVLCFKF